MAYLNRLTNEAFIPQPLSSQSAISFAAAASGSLSLFGFSRPTSHWHHRSSHFDEYRRYTVRHGGTWRAWVLSAPGRGNWEIVLVAQDPLSQSREEFDGPSEVICIDE